MNSVAKTPTWSQRRLDGQNVLVADAEGSSCECMHVQIARRLDQHYIGAVETVETEDGKKHRNRNKDFLSTPGQRAPGVVERSRP